MKSILIAGALRFVQMIFTFGTGAPSGLFIPSLLTGAAIGRALGTLVYQMNEAGPLANFTEKVYPGVYAMIGAAAVLGGVCRVTISLVVIMFELTSGLQLIVPFMIACMSAKWTGDLFGEGIYDKSILTRKYPYLHEPDEKSFKTTAGDIMDEGLECFSPEPGMVGNLVRFLKTAKYGGYPVTRSKTDRTLLGYLHTAELYAHLKQELDENPLIEEKTPCIFKKFVDDPNPRGFDISKYVDMTVTRAVPEMPAAQIHAMFRSLGIKLILIQNGALLAGCITKKSFIKYMDDIHHHGENTHKHVRNTVMDTTHRKEGLGRISVKSVDAKDEKSMPLLSA
jgi:chloride channel 3/4/5